VKSVKPNQGLVALYFLFTQPGTQWKKLLATPLVDGYDITLSADNLVDVSEHKSFFGW